MRVALDATPLALASGGLRRYTAELSLALAKEFPEDRFVLASDREFPMPPGGFANLKAAPGPRGVLERRWWTWGLTRVLRRERIDVFHGTNFEVPYRRVLPSVLTLHDLSPWKGYEASRRVRLRTPLLLRLRIPDMVIVPTEAVRGEAISRFGLAPERVVAVPEAASPALRRVEASPAAPYFLYVGDAVPRKNADTIVSAWREVRKLHPVDLVLVGDFAGGCDARVVRHPDDARLSELYSGARAVLYPSLYEGFGLPVIEAMQCGAAVFASKDPAVMEVSGGAAVHLDALDVRAWARALTAACEDAAWIGELRERSSKRACAFSWRATACRTREVYEEARRRHGA